MYTSIDFVFVNGKKYRLGEQVEIRLNRGKEKNQFVAHEDSGRIILLDAEATANADIQLCVGAVILARVSVIKENFSIVEPIEVVRYPDVDRVVKESVLGKETAKLVSELIPEGSTFYCETRLNLSNLSWVGKLHEFVAPLVIPYVFSISTRGIANGTAKELADVAKKKEKVLVVIRNPENGVPVCTPFTRRITASSNLITIPEDLKFAMKSYLKDKLKVTIYRFKE
jgi:hypothetical protein